MAASKILNKNVNTILFESQDPKQYHRFKLGDHSCKILFKDSTLFYYCYISFFKAIDIALEYARAYLGFIINYDETVLQKWLTPTR